MEIKANFQGKSPSEIFGVSPVETKIIEKFLLDIIEEPLNNIVEKAFKKLEPILIDQISEIADKKIGSLKFQSHTDVKLEMIKICIQEGNMLDLTPEGNAALFYILGTVEKPLEDTFINRFTSKVQEFVKNEFAKKGLGAGIFMAAGPAGKEEINRLEKLIKGFETHEPTTWPGTPKAEA